MVIYTSIKLLSAWIDRIKKNKHTAQDIKYQNIYFELIGRLRVHAENQDAKVLAEMDADASQFINNLKYIFLSKGKDKNFDLSVDKKNLIPETTSIYPILDEPHNKVSELFDIATMKACLPTAQEIKIWQQLDSKANYTKTSFDRSLNYRDSLCYEFEKYISPWKLSLFGHHHEKRALAVQQALMLCNNTNDMIDVLKNQKELFEKTPASKKLSAELLSTQWSSQVQNKAKKGFYRLICHALEMAEMFNLQEETLSNALSYGV
jgi:hypothetical protein